MSHCAVPGLVFGGLVSVPSIESSGKVVGSATGYGVVIRVLLAALLVSVWLSAVGSPANPPFPNFAIPSLLWHIVDGAVVVGVFVAVRDGF